MLSVFILIAFLFFLINKKGISKCSHFKVTYEQKQMGARLRLANGNVKRNTKTTIAHWIGSLIISLLFIISAIFGSYWTNKAKKSLQILL